MKILICGILFTMTTVVLGSTKQPLAMSSTPAKLHYLEVYPNQTLNLEFTADRLCPTDKIQLRSFESSAEYPSAESGKLQKVRVINLYAESFSPCSTMPKGKIHENFKVPPDPLLATHIYVTTGEGVGVRQE